jgi:Asp-tRNA(Asn)/Glu-tRNA(Gln) amidotransferase A subunit family amidase
MLRLTQLFNMTGHPSLALPAPQDVDALPRGIQIVGRRHQTDRVLAIGQSVARDLGHHAE